MTDISDTVQESLSRRVWKGYCRYAMAPKLMLLSATPVYAHTMEQRLEDAALGLVIAAGVGAYLLFRKNK